MLQASRRVAPMSTREEKVKQRVKAGHSKIVKRLQDAQAADLNEADTSALVAHILQTLLGYDPLDDLTQQYKVRGLYADYGVKIDGQLVAFVEVKSARTALNERHLRQVEQYATSEGVDWLILTNGARWQVYHVTFTRPITRDLVIDIDITAAPAVQLVEELYYLSKESLRRGEIERLWRERTAVGPCNLVRVLFSAPVIDRIRKELRSITGYNPSPEDLAQSIRDLLAPKVLEEATGVFTQSPAAPRRRGRPRKADSPGRPVKIESGIRFPAEAYAYVPDPSAPSTWKVRLWENLEDRVTRAQLGRAASAVSPSGFRGRPLAIPPEEMVAVKAKIREWYRLLNIPQDEMPPYLSAA
jgi:hypothetical protein